MSKKLLALLLAMIMIVGSFTSVLAETAKTEEPAKTEEKTDEKAEEPAKTEEKEEEKKEEEPAKTEDPALDRAIEVLKKAGFISGYSADSEDFKVEKNVKRSEFASMIVRAKGLEASAKSLATVPTGFKDVPTNHWANGYIAVAKQQGFVNGYTDGTFRPDRQISYQDMATMLTIALGQAEVGTVYPAGYIVKAQQLGLFNNVNVPAYTDMATRGDVFKMLHNMITSKEFGQRNIVKAIVLENSRIEKLAEDEVTVEIISLIQKANWVGKNRAEDKKGDQHTYKLDKDLKLDPEFLLGKVVDITTTEDDKIVDVKVDESYDYLEGKITSVDAYKFGLNGTKYTALFDERYDRDDERIYRTYLNNKDYKYEDFAAKYTKGTDYNYARVTVKNSKVVFIDAYKFKDIAPVAEVKDGTVWYYDDARNAAIVKANDLTRVVFNTKTGYTVGSTKEVVRDDVIHLYEDYRDKYDEINAIVKKDAMTEQVMTDTHRTQNGVEWVVLEDKSEHWIHHYKDIPFRAIYSYEGKQFLVVQGRQDLAPVRGRKVKVLTALDGSVQLVESDLAWNDGINAIRKIASYGEVNLLPAKGEAFWAKEGRKTSYYDARRANNQILHEDFDLNDIVYYNGEGNEGEDQTILKMGIIAKKKDSRNQEGYVSQLRPASINSRYLTLLPKDITGNAVNYRYFDTLNAYYLDGEAKNGYGNLQQVGDINKFIADNKDNNELKAYVISEYDLKMMLEVNKYAKTYNFLSDSEVAKGVARVVVFADAIEPYDTNKVYAVVTDKYNDTNRVLFRDADNTLYDVLLNGDGMDPDDFEEDDIVELRITKDSVDKDQKVGYVKQVVIKRDQATKFITDAKFINTYYIDGERKFFDNGTKEFNRLAGDYVQVYEDPNAPEFVRVIRYSKYAIGKVEETFRCILKGIDEDTNQFEVDYVNGSTHNKYFKIRTNVERATHFVAVNSNGRTVEDYGFGLAGLKKFFDKFEGGTVKVTVDERDSNIAVLVEGLMNDVQLAQDYVDQAKKIVEDLGKQEYEFGTPDQASREPRTASTGNNFRQKAIDAIKEAGLNRHVEVQETTPKNGKLETVIKSLETVKVNGVDTPKAQATAINEYSIKSEKESNQDKLNAILPRLKNGSFGISATTNANDRVKELAEAELKSQNIDYDPAKLSVTTNAAAKENTYTVEITYGDAGKQGTINFAIELKPAK